LISASIGITIFGSGLPAWSAASATTTALAVTSGGSAVTTVAPGSVVTLTATVSAGAAPVTTGQVKFCDAAAAFCTDIHVLGAAQLTSAGTAALKIVPAIGSHSYKAMFLGTAGNAASTSGEATVTVTATVKTATSIDATGSLGTFNLMATVSESGSEVPPTGTVSFLDTSNGNAVLGTAELEKSTAALTWTGAASPAVGPGLYALAVGDFDGDGIADLAVTSKESGTVTILSGSGDGTFTQAAGSAVPAGSEPVALLPGDFNGDGSLDLAVANFGDGTVTVLLGNGDGTFTEAAGSPVTVGTQPGSVAMEDFNGDGIPDLAVANFGDGTVTILLGTGDGTFTEAAGSPVSAGITPYSVAAGDFNGDGIPDLAVANGSAYTVTILMGNGDGTFKPAADNAMTPGFGPTFIAVADFNRDGNADLALVNNGNNAVSILLGNGNGTFTPAAGSPVKVGTSPYSVIVGDFDGDGIADLAVANACGNGPTCSASSYKGTVTILEGKGDGTFTPASGSPVPVGNWPIAVAAGDINGDGIADLAITNYGSGTVSVLLTHLTETATAEATDISPAGTGVHQVDASYPGEGTYSGSTSATTAVNVQPATPTVTVTPSATSITKVQELSVTIAIGGRNGDPEPTGTVTLTSGSYVSSATALNGGSATVTIPAGSLAIGSDTLTANYTGDNNYSTASGAGALIVQLATPAVTVTPNATSISTGQALLVTIAISGGIGDPTPTGTVTLTSGSYASSATTLNGGSATITIPAGSLAIGSDTLTANYAGDNNYSTVSGTASVTVAAPPNPTFTVSGSAVTIAEGATTGNTSTITVTPAGDFTGDVILTASVASSPTGALSAPTLSFGSTSPVRISSTAAGTAMLTITTTSPTKAALTSPNPPGAPWYARGGAAFCCILLFGIAARRSRWQARLGMFALFGMLAGGVVSCSGGKSTVGTTPGKYTISVTGTSGAITANCTVNLTVN